MISLGSGSNNKKQPSATDSSNNKTARPSGASSLHYFPGLQSPLSMTKDVTTTTNNSSPNGTPEKQKRRGAGSSILNKIKRRSRKGHKDDVHKDAGAATGAGSSPTTFLGNWLTESDRQNKLRTVVKVLTLLCFSPFFALQWAINKCATLNQSVLDWAPTVVDFIYTNFVAPVTRFFVKMTSSIAGVWHQYVLRPLYQLGRSAVNLMVPPVANAWAKFTGKVDAVVNGWLVPRIKAIPTWVWKKVYGAYTVVWNQWLPALWAKICGVGPWCRATFVTPVVNRVKDGMHFVYRGIIMDKVCLPVKHKVVGGWNWGKDGVEVVGICYRILVKGEKVK